MVCALREAVSIRTKGTSLPYRYNKISKDRGVSHKLRNIEDRAIETRFKEWFVRVPADVKHTRPDKKEDNNSNTESDKNRKQDHWGKIKPFGRLQT